MSGCIIGAFGYQRSGKTLMSYLLAYSYYRKGCKVYTNMDVPEFTKINSLMDIPFNSEAKVLLLDEVYWFMDSRKSYQNADASIFFNTCGKQNILLIITAISPDMIEKRLREQMNYVYLVKSDVNQIHYKLFDTQRGTSSIFHLEKSPKLFQSLTYDTLQIPSYIDCDLKQFRKKVDDYYSSFAV